MNKKIKNLAQFKTEGRRGKLSDISSYDRESDYLTSRQAMMNLSIRGIHAEQGGTCATS